MRKSIAVSTLLLSLLVGFTAPAQDNKTAQVNQGQTTSVADRMAKARAAKADKKAAKDAAKNDGTGLKDDRMTKPADSKVATSSSKTMKEEKASPADYKAPVDTKQKGPNNEVVHTGPKGGKYYINKNGNKTYLSSNN